MIAIATRTRGRIIHTSNGKTVFQRYGKDDSECNYSISRYELNKVPTPNRSRSTYLCMRSAMNLLIPTVMNLTLKVHTF